MKTNRILFLSIALIMLVFSFVSCDNSGKKIPGKKIVISVASDYYETNSINNLNNPVNDQAAFIAQMKKLIPESEIYMFRGERGTKYISNSVIDLETSATPQFSYKAAPDNATMYTNSALYLDTDVPNTVTKHDWRMSDVLTLLINLETTNEDLIIFHYSGHGLDGKGDLIGGVTTVGNSGYGILDTLSPSSILNILNKKDGLFILFIDACYSGNFIESGVLASADRFSDRIEGGRSTNIYTYSSLLHTIDQSIDIMLGNTTTGFTNIYAISASSSKQLSYDGSNSGGKNQGMFGAFSYYLLLALDYDVENLTPAKNSSMISFYSVYENLWESFSPALKYEQTPRATLSPIDVVIAF